MSLTWKIEDDEGVAQVKIIGAFDEDGNFEPLLQELSTRNSIRFDLERVERINSCGVREWVNFVRSFVAPQVATLLNCSPAVVAQLNMITNFAGQATIISVFAPYVCDTCGHEDRTLTDVNPGVIPTLEDPKCSKCGEMMAFDDLEDSYFAFLF